MAGGLAPSPRGLGRCLGCGTAWERVYSTECPGCGFGWVHIHHPDHVDAVGRQPVFAQGFGWCDGCDSHVSYRWFRNPPHEEHIDPTIHLTVVGGEGRGKARRTRSDWADEAIVAS